MSTPVVSLFFFQSSFLLVRSFIRLPALLREDYPVPASDISIPSEIGTAYIARNNDGARLSEKREMYVNVRNNEKYPGELYVIFAEDDYRN